ncbi:MAG TPA: hypothetical protein VGM08_04320 [Candidatus Saccharimonadales bacterium]|jgi:hypothetical protein
MSELPQDNQSQSPPMIPLPSNGTSAEGQLLVSYEGPKTQEQWKTLLKEDVLAEGGYIDQMYPPYPKPVGELNEAAEAKYRRNAERRERDKQKDRQGMLEREEAWFDKIYTAGTKVAEGNEDPVELFFDVDNTITDFSVDDNRVMRPAFRRVIDALHEKLGDRLQIGILTTMDAPWVLEHCLESIDPAVIAPEYILDVRTYARQANPAGMDEEESRKELRTVSLERLADILNPDLYDAIADRVLDPDTVYSESKLETVSELYRYALLRQALGYRTDRARIVFVDNMLYAGMLTQANPYIMGVNVGSEIQGSLGRQMYAAQLVTLEKELANNGLSWIQLAL